MAVFQESVSEGITLSDVESDSIVAVESLSDGVSLGDSQQEGELVVESGSEGLEFSDSASITVKVSANDGIKLGDSESTISFPAKKSVDDGVQLGDTESSTATASVSVTDGIRLGDQGYPAEPEAGRGLDSTQLQAAQSQQTDVVHLIALTYYDDGTQNESVTRLTTAPVDIDADVGNGVVTFSGAGGFLSWGSITESEDRSAQGMTLKLSGVDQSIVSIILNNQFRGRSVKLWRQYFDGDTGQAVGNPIKLFDGRQMGDYEVEENWGDTGSLGTVTITTRVKSILADLQQLNAVRTNPRSYNNALARVGLTTDNTFFNKVKSFAGKRIFWGTDAPDEAQGTNVPRGPIGHPGGGGGGGHTENPEQIAT